MAMLSLWEMAKGARMILEEIVSIYNFEVAVKFSYFEKEPCRPNIFEPGSPEEFEIHKATIISDSEIPIDISKQSIIDLIINALKQKQILNKAA